MQIERLSPAIGFESFTASIHRVIEEAGPGTFYVFDCLSDLAADWYSDLMPGQLLHGADGRLDAVSRLDVWDRRSLHARDVRAAFKAGMCSPAAEREVFHATLRMVLTRDERFAELAARHLDLDDLFAVRRRMIGTGLVGGKAAGVLLARAILAENDGAWGQRLEPHDSWFIGSDVFYTYLVRNGCWRARRDQRNRTSFLKGAAEAPREPSTAREGDPRTLWLNANCVRQEVLCYLRQR